MSAATPAECGLDIDVPAMAWKNWPCGPGVTYGAPVLVVGWYCGVMPARICTPGAVTSGLMKSPTGPRDENAAITSPRTRVAVPLAQVAFTPVFAAKNASTLAELPVEPVEGPLMWIADNQWLSESRSWFAVLYRIIPAAPPCRTLYPLSTRPLVPRRQMTTFPVYVPAGAGLRQSLLGSVAVAFARTTSVGVRVPAVTVTPGTWSVGPFVEVRCSVGTKCLFYVEAP